jgi:hypothetical protein
VVVAVALLPEALVVAEAVVAVVEPQMEMEQTELQTPEAVEVEEQASLEFSMAAMVALVL